MTRAVLGLVLACGCGRAAAPPVGAACDPEGGVRCSSPLACAVPGPTAAGGICTTACGPEAPCGGGALCARASDEGWICLPRCPSSTCRPGWSCDAALGACRPDDAAADLALPVGRAADGGPCVPSGTGPNPGLRTAWAANVRLPPPVGSRREWAPSVAVDPASSSGRVAVVALTDDELTWPAVALWLSDDGGATWPSEAVSVVDAGGTWRVGDPAVAFDHQGGVVVVYRAFRVAGGRSVESRLLARWRAADAPAFSPPVAVSPDDGTTGVVLGQPFLDAGFDVLAASWVRVDGEAGAATVELALSHDGGRGWEVPATLSAAAGDHAWPVVRVDPTGGTRALWLERRAEGHRVWFAAVSSAGTPGTPIVVSPPDEPVAPAPVALGAGLGSVVYAAWSAARGGSAWDVDAMASSTGGTIWPKVAVKANEDDTCATHALVAGLSDADAIFHLAWFENRRGPGMLVDATVARAGFLTPNRAVSDRPFPLVSSRRDPGWPGERPGLALRGTTMFAAWADARAGDGAGDGRAHVYVTSGNVNTIP